MDQKLYAPPQSDLRLSENINVPKEITQKIKNAWIVGLVSAGLTVIATIISIYGTDILGLDATAFIDVVFMLVFTFGIYKNSRVCAVLMLTLFVVNKIFMWVESDAPSGFLLSAIVLWFYSQGVIGTFQYHRHVNKVVDGSDLRGVEISDD